MRLRILYLATAAMLATGCATVDITEFTAPDSIKVEAPAEKNIVLRAADKLYAAFRSKGFVAKTSREKMQSAASVLLNGLEQRELTADSNYPAQAYSQAVVNDDIAFATDHVRQMANAAEIYFELSEGGKKLREELGGLENALLSSREASNTFENVVGSEGFQIITLRAEIDRLRRITDKFGRRVRERALADAAARREEYI